jgi:ergothioneine biosynthesis protein EgtB
MTPPSLASALRRQADEDQTTAISKPADDIRTTVIAAFRTVRAETERRCASLGAEDQTVQSMADASPAKWHRAHTTWFFEQFLLVPRLAGYCVFDEHYAYLFNSYYVTAGPRHARPLRGLLTRPTCAEIGAYRRHVDAAVEQLVEGAADADLKHIFHILEVGLHHEQQHQELVVTDILHAFAQNPLFPAYASDWRPLDPQPARDQLAELPSGIHSLGFDGKGFRFDNEQPAHRIFLEPARIGRALVRNGQWLEFMSDKGYTTPSLWLSDGWAAVEVEGWDAPGYWRNLDGSWFSMTLAGLKPVDPDAPVTHVSYYEADAFARWAGKHLPTEAEWEIAARTSLIDDAFGAVWQWTRSAYLPYPGYRPAPGALGEYNGKFMVSQMVLRGSSHATPHGHARVSYRNFFYPGARWQFSGLRLIEYPNDRENTSPHGSER